MDASFTLVILKTQRWASQHTYAHCDEKLIGLYYVQPNELPNSLAETGLLNVMSGRGSAGYQEFSFKFNLEESFVMAKHPKTETREVQVNYLKHDGTIARRGKTTMTTTIPETITYNAVVRELPQEEPKTFKIIYWDDDD